jgi:hypothetical protein
MATPVASAHFRWHRLSLAETDASDRASAACYCRAEHTGHSPLIVAELKLGHAKRQIFGADLVESAHDAALAETDNTGNL